MRTQNGTLISRHQQDKALRSTQCLSLTFYPARQMLPSLWRSTLSLPPEDILIGSSGPAPLTSAGLKEHPRFCDSIISWSFKLWLALFHHLHMPLFSHLPFRCWSSLWASVLHSSYCIHLLSCLQIWGLHRPKCLHENSAGLGPDGLRQ